MPKAFGYGRVSTTKQKDNQTREDQELYCLQIFRQVYKPKGYEWAGFHFDVKSGGKPFSEREQGRQVFFSLERGDVLIVSQMDRLWRNKVDGIATLDQLEKRGIDRHVGDIGDLSGFKDNPVALDLVETNLVFAAHILRKMKSQEMSRKNTVKRENGIPVSNTPPMGWKIVGEGMHRRFRVDRNERRMIDAMAELADQGATPFEISLWAAHRQVREEFQPKKGRDMRDVKYVRWALNARIHGYPLIEGRKRFERAMSEGTVMDFPTTPGSVSLSHA
jgi:DNA invertase Pin-like site-specific DNA recombinase